MRDMRGSRSLIPGTIHSTASNNTSSLISISSSVTIFLVRSLISDSRSISGVAGSHIRRSSVCGKSIGVLLEIGGTLWLALPELALGRAGCVTVVGGGAESALLAAVADEAEFDEDGEEKENKSNNCNGETSSLELTCSVQAREPSETTVSLVDSVACLGVSRSERSVDISSAAVGATSSCPRHVDESSSEAKIEDHANDAEESDAS